MTLEKDVLGIVPGLQATALVGANLGAIKPLLKMKPTKKVNFKKTTGSMVKLGVTNILGTSLIGATAAQINKL